MSDVDKLKTNVIQYYFPDFSIELYNDISFITLINDNIKNSRYGDSLKASLYSFFIDPGSVVKILLEELLIVQASKDKSTSLLEISFLNFSLILILITWLKI